MAPNLLQRLFRQDPKTFINLRDWFRALYEVRLGQSQGPRFGSFVALFGRDRTVALIRRALGGEDLSAA